jgi:small-conductance mechanosensitive channel
VVGLLGGELQLKLQLQQQLQQLHQQLQQQQQLQLLQQQQQQQLQQLQHQQLHQREKIRVTEHKMCGAMLSTNVFRKMFYSVRFLILYLIQSDVIMNVGTSACEVRHIVRF